MKVFTGTQQRKKYPEDFAREIKNKYGLNISFGVKEVIKYPEGGKARFPLYSLTQIEAAWKMELKNGEEIVWKNEESLGGVEAPETVIIFEMAMGNGAPYPQPSGKFDLYINDQYLLSFALTKESRLWRGKFGELYFQVKKMKGKAFGESFTLDSQIKDESILASGTGFLRIRSNLLDKSGVAKIKVVANTRRNSKRWFRIGAMNMLGTTNFVDGLEEMINYQQVEEFGGYKLLFGDIHTHSGEGHGDYVCGEGHIEDHYKYARDVACLDFYCLTDHDTQMAEKDWKYIKVKNEEYNEPGRFVTIPGYEWTSHYYGHRNVYFKEPIDEFPLCWEGEDGSKYDSIGDGRPTPRDLWQWLDETGVEAITVPHHPSAAPFPLTFDNYFNPKYDRLIEIYSCWGDSLEADNPVNTNADRYHPLSFINYMPQNYPVGFIASSDGHDGNPGLGQGGNKRSHLYHWLGSGRAVVLAEKFTRSGIFEALKNRRCYATTGEHIKLSFTVNGYPMGQIIEAERLSSSPCLEVKAEGTTNIKELKIYRNGKVVFQKDYHDMYFELSWQDKEMIEADVNYFVKITQGDEEIAWSSPIWIKN